MSEEKDTKESAQEEGLDCACEQCPQEEECSEAQKNQQKAYEDKCSECDGYIDQIKRLGAEFDNFRKRTIKEKEAVYSNAVSDTVSGILPVLDNLERAVEAAKDENSNLKEGVELVLKQLKAFLDDIGVEEIPAVGQVFDPEVHNAVMHEESEDHDSNMVIEEFQKGFKFKDKVIRHSMVKVVN